MNVFVIAFKRPGGLDPFLEFLDQTPDVSDWMVIFGQAVLIASERTVPRLTKLIDKRFPDALFFISEVDATRCNGKLPAEVWDFVNGR